MRWKVLCNGVDLIDDNNTILDPTLELALNKAGAFSFTIDSRHPQFSNIVVLQSVIEVWEEDKLRFRGYPIRLSYDFYNQLFVECEGELAKLNNIHARPFSFPINPTRATVAIYLEYLITMSNNGGVKFNGTFLTRGTVQISDTNVNIRRSDTEYSSIWQLINEGLLDVYGGYIVLRYGNDGEVDEWGNTPVYLDYLKSFPTRQGQSIRFGINMLDIKTEKDGNDIATVIVPLGAKIEGAENRLTISSIPNQNLDWNTAGDILKFNDYIYRPTTSATYGMREIVVIWDDVTTASYLLKKAKAFYDDLWRIRSTTTISAIDMKNVTGEDVESLEIGDIIPVDSPPHQQIHGFNNQCLVERLSINLLNPAESKLTVETTVTL